MLQFDGLEAGDYELRLMAVGILDHTGIPLGSQIVSSTFSVVAATIQWNNPNGGSWHDHTNWLPERLPTLADDVFVDLPQADSIAFIQGSTSIRSLYMRNSFKLLGGSLTVATFLQIDGEFVIGNNATLRSATVRPGADGSPLKLIAPPQDSDRATLDGVTLDRAMLVEQAMMTIRNGLTVNSTLVVRKRSGDRKLEPFPNTVLIFAGSQYLAGTGSVMMDGTFGWARMLIQTSEGGSLIIRNGLEVLSRGVQITIEGSLTNHGSLRFDLGWYDNEVISTTIDNHHVVGTVGGNVALLYLRTPLLVNRGSIETRGMGRVLFDVGAFTNSGIIDAQGGGQVVVNSDDKWSSNGMIRSVEGSVVSLHGAYSLTGNRFDSRTGRIVLHGVIDNRNDVMSLDRTTGSLEINSWTVFRGRVASEDGEGFIVTGSSTLDGVTLDGALKIDPRYTVTVKNGLTLNGTITLETFFGPGFEWRAFLDFVGEGILEGIGQVVLTGPLGNWVRPVGVGASLRIGPEITIRGGQGFIGDANLPLINEGTILAETESGQPANLMVRASEFQNVGILFVDGSSSRLQVNATLTTNTGRIRANSGSRLDLFGLSSNQGTVVAENDTVVRITNPMDLADGVLISGKWEIGPRSVIRLWGGSISSIAANVTLAGAASDILIQDSSTSALTSLSTVAASGVLSITSGRSFGIPGDLTNAGRLAVGNESSVNVNQNFTQLAGAALHVTLADPTQFGRMAVTNRAMLSGALLVEFASGYQPVGGESYDILTFRSREGEFSDELAIGLGERLRLESTYLDTSLTITAIRDFLAGDTNGDGRVDIDDLNAVRNNFGQSGMGVIGDANGDGRVDIDDLNAVRNNFGAGTEVANRSGHPAPSAVDMSLSDDFLNVAVDETLAKIIGAPSTVTRGYNFSRIPLAAELFGQATPLERAESFVATAEIPINAQSRGAGHWRASRGHEIEITNKAIWDESLMRFVRA